MRIRLLSRLAACGVLSSASLSAQGTPLIVQRDGRPDVSLTVDALRTLPGDTISLSSHGAPPVRYRAVTLLSVMAAAGSPIDSLKLGRTGWIVVARAKDGYVAVFSASELEPTLGPTRAWIAFERDGAPLAADEAPYRFIVPTDAKGTRGARMITTLRIFDPLAAPAKP